MGTTSDAAHPPSSLSPTAERTDLRARRPQRQAYDQHLNMILGDVEETITQVDIDDETYEEIVQSRRRRIPFLFVRGDVIVLCSPPLRSGLPAADA